jgi:hypothetical protein
MTTFTERLVKPTDCAIGFGIPLNEAGFMRSSANPHSDFVKRFLGGWPHYRAALVCDLEDVLPILMSWGVTIISELTLDSFRSVCHQATIVTIFSHWRRDSVEFSDGLHPFLEVADAIPNDFVGVIDLCVCHPQRLVDAIAARRPRCLVRYIPVEANASYWLYFYRTLFACLRAQDQTYLRCLEAVIAAFRAPVEAR